ncbi:hypothetical protein KC669_01165 [Candidatus Dojkabacteria bacterium]|uniref:Uncharacterized protein n=1 Tax=Candidatus Dojkabacteria bacterium TaxID=2099670 RepID=A0A955RLR2_9BACT|nr:hypothetical protein [Candidatus Dojkabacteria bacterium]
MNSNQMDNSEVEDYALQDKLNSAAEEAIPKPDVVEIKQPKVDDPKRNSKLLIFAIMLLAIVGIIIALFVIFISLPKATQAPEVLNENKDENLESDNFRLETDDTITIDDSEKSSKESIDDTISDLDTFFEDLNTNTDFESLDINYDE